MRKFEISFYDRLVKYCERCGLKLNPFKLEKKEKYHRDTGERKDLAWLSYRCKKHKSEIVVYCWHGCAYHYGVDSCFNNWYDAKTNENIEIFKRLKPD